MRLELTKKEIEEIVEAVKSAAAVSNRFANTATIEGYPQHVADEAAKKAGDLYLLVDKISYQKRRTHPKPLGSSGNVDPFDNPTMNETKPPKGESKFDGPQTPNDPIEW